jgi:hypothetical protein
MTTPVDERRRSSRFEQHAQTILATCIALGLAWAGSKIQDVSDRLIRVEAVQLSESATRSALFERMSRVEQEVKDLQLQNAKRGLK